MKGRPLYLVIILIGLVVSFGLVRNLYSIYQNSKFQDQAVRKLEKLRTENTKLKEEVTTSQEQSFIEREARERLGLVKPGEVVVILPSEKEASPSAQSLTEVKTPRSIWQQWVSLFFGG